jgi:hypothetical protein
MSIDAAIDNIRRVAKSNHICDLHEDKKKHEDNVVRILPELLFPLIYDPNIPAPIKAMAEELMDSMKRISDLEKEIRQEYEK